VADRLRPQNAGLSRLGGGIEAVRNLGPGALDSSQPGALGSQTGTWVRLPGANFPPAGALPVDEMGDAVIAPTATAVLLTYQVPTNLILRVEGIGFGADDETALAFLSWSMKLNGDTVPGYVNKPSAVGSIRNLTPIFQVAGTSSVLTITATPAAAAVLAYRYICRIRGWCYNEREAV
jgi:hypothetical protein